MIRRQSPETCVHVALLASLITDRRQLDGTGFAGDGVTRKTRSHRQILSVS